MRTSFHINTFRTYLRIDNENIKQQLVASFIAAISTALLGAMVVSGYQIFHLSIKDFESSSSAALKQADQYLTLFVDETLQNVTQLSNDPRIQNSLGELTSYANTTSTPTTNHTVMTTAEKEIFFIFESAVKNHKNYDAVFMGTSDGGFTVAPDMPLFAGFDPTKRGWYADAMQSSSALMTSAYLSSDGTFVSTVTKAVKDTSGKTIGAIGVDVRLSTLTTLTNSIKIGKTGYVMLVQNDGTIISDPKHTDFGFKKLTETGLPAYKLFNDKTSGVYDIELNNVTQKANIYTSPTLGWKLICIIDESEVTSGIYDILWKLSLFGIILLIILSGVSYMVASSISNPIVVAVTHIAELAQGNVKRDVPAEMMERSNEIGDLATSMNNLVNTTRDKILLAESIANGDLSHEVKLASEDDILGVSLEKMTANLNDLINVINSTTQLIASNSTHVSDSSNALSQGATEQAASIEEITSSMAEINSMTKANAENAVTANQNSKEAMQIARVGADEMTQMVSAMTDITESSDNIKRIIKVVDEIAFQTNLLALNAAVEAARAGQHGKGFAVVAEEVRNLAGRSAKTAAETEDLIEQSAERVNNGTQIVNKTAESLDGIIATISTTANLVADISKASDEQSIGIDHISIGLNQIDTVTQQNTASAEETASAAEELASQARRLQEVVARFKLKSHTQTNYIPLPKY